MLPIPILRLAGALAALCLVGALAVMPAAADTCGAATATHADATGGVALTHSAEFTCADAAGAGSWSITVEVANGSGATVVINEATLAGVSPSVGADGDARVDATLESSGLPLAISAGESGSFQLGGNYALAQVGTVALANLHIRASGVSATAGTHPVTLAINVHMLAPGSELSTGANARTSVASGAGAEGRGRAAEASVGAVAMLAAFFRDGLPWDAPGFDAALGADAAAAAAAQAGGAGVDAGAGVGAAGTASAGVRSERVASGSDAGAERQAQAEADAHVEVEVGGSSSISLPVLGD